MNARARERYRKNPSLHAERTKRYRKKNPEKWRDIQLRFKYGVTNDEYTQLLEAQNGVCALCSQPEIQIDRRTKKLRMLAVDHCHDTARIRGLLCSRCNTGIGSLRDDPELMRRAADYIEERRKEDWQLISSIQR